MFFLGIIFLYQLIVLKSDCVHICRVHSLVTIGSGLNEPWKLNAQQLNSTIIAV